MKQVSLTKYDQRRTHTSAVWNAIQGLKLRYLDVGVGKNYYDVPTGKITQEQLEQMLYELETAWVEEAK